ncbi:MAG: DUF2500 family protein [Clostridia bacterium]|nr:DUF2500 family protein [Clostridia bacterium]
MANVFGNIINAIMILIFFAIVAGIISRLLGEKYATVKCVKAVVTDKQYIENLTHSKWQSMFPQRNYVITFDCGGRKLHFDVSEISYNNYKIGQSGVLQYRGKTLIDFS